MTRLFLILTALVEGATGLVLLVVPDIPLSLLLGLNHLAPETLFSARVAGAALCSLGVASWLARDDSHSPALTGLLVGLLFYNASAAGLLVWTGLAWHLSGVGLWGAVMLHTLLTGYNSVCLWQQRGTSPSL